MRAVARRRLLVSAGGLLAAPALVRAQATNGVALVIGNSRYKREASLPNVKRDVPDIARAFQALGLKTELLEDLGRDALRKAIQKFGETSQGARLAAIPTSERFARRGQSGGIQNRNFSGSEARCFGAATGYFCRDVCTEQRISRNDSCIQRLVQRRKRHLLALVSRKKCRQCAYLFVTRRRTRSAIQVA